MRSDLEAGSFGKSGWRGLVVPAVLLAAWCGATALGIGNQHILVSPLKVIAAAVEAIRDEGAISAALHSLARFLSGWAIGSTIGLLAGLALGLSRTTERVGGPTFHALRQIALFAWLPLLSAWFGIYDAPKVVLISLAAFFPTALNTQAGALGVSRAYREVGRVLELGRIETIRKIILPAAAPSILAGLQLGLVAAWIGTVGSEYLIGNGEGLGVLLSAAREANRMDLVIFCIATLGLSGLVINHAVRIVTRRLIARHLPA